MTLADQAAITGHDGQVAEGQPGRPKRRTFTAAYKARILAAFDALPEGSPERGELLRRERLYHSHLEHWRGQQEKGTLPGTAMLVRLEDSGMGRQMSEYVQHAVLRYLRRFDEYALAQARCEWHVLAPHPHETFTVGVLGLGVLGAQVAHAVASLGVPVRGFSRSAKTIEGIETFSGELHGPQFDAFLDGVKVLVNLLPATPDTESVLNARTFGKLSRGAYLVNVARGTHLDEQDLLDALASGTLAAATLDVFREEPLPPDHLFWREPRITITPHCSALTLRDEAISQVADKIGALARGETVSGVVHVGRGY